MWLIISIIVGIALFPLTLTFYYIHRMRKFERALKSSKKKVLCPHCLHIVPLEWFRCDVCFHHNMLVASEKAIDWQYCTSCGQKLPTNEKVGRNELIALCPDCGHELGKHQGEHEEFIIPIIGGPSTGKTAFMDAWIVAAYRTFTNKYNITYPFQRDANRAKRCLQNWDKGQRPEKTQLQYINRRRSKVLQTEGGQFSDVATATCNGMDIVPKEHSRGLRIYMFDPAGEFFDSGKQLLDFTYYDFMDGVVFLIDPFAILSVKNDYNSNLKDAENMGFQVANRDADEICDRFINSLLDYHNLSINEYHYAYCAVVITKTDSFDLDEKIGQKAIERYMKKNSSLSYLDAMNILCANYLKKAGVGQILRKLEDHFEEVRCFSASAFGHMPDTKERYIPERIDLPIKWIIKKASKLRKKSKLQKLFTQFLSID